MGDIVVANQDTIHILREKSLGNWIEESSSRQSSSIVSFACLPNGDIAIGCMDHSIRIISRHPEISNKWKTEIVMKDCGDWPWSMACFPDGRIVVGTNGQIIVCSKVCSKVPFLEDWDFEEIDLGRVGHVKSITCLQDGSIVSANGKKYACVWRKHEPSGLWDLKAKLTGHDSVNSVAYLPDGGVAFGVCDKTVRVWHTNPTGEWFESAVIPGFTSILQPITSFSDGAIAFPTDGDMLQIWEKESSSEKWTCTGKLKSTSGEFSKVVYISKNRLFSINNSNTIQCWESRK